MKSRQLALFVLACQHLSHAEAAAFFGISPSAVSENISALEAELGLDLFFRGPLGHVPTGAARWLFQQAEPLLQLLEIATTKQTVDRVEYLSVSSSLQFMFGKLSRILALSGRMLRERYPGTVTKVAFRSADNDVSSTSSDLFFEYRWKSNAAAIPLFDDDWVIVSATSLNKDAASIDSLKHAERLWIPPLPIGLQETVLDYCRQHSISLPEKLSADTDPFLFLNQQKNGNFLLAPRHLVIGGVTRYKFSMLPLDLPLVSPVVAHISAEDDTKRLLAMEFLGLLEGVLREPTPVLYYDPIISLQHLRLVATLARCKSLSKAAGTLNVAQPALSMQLKKLEGTIGLKLFARQSDGLFVSPDASPRIHLMQEAHELVEQIQSMAAKHRQQRQTDISIGITPLCAETPAVNDALLDALARYAAGSGNPKLRIIEKPAADLDRDMKNGYFSFVLSEKRSPNLRRIDLYDAGVLGIVSFRSEDEDVLSPVEELARYPAILPPEGEMLRDHLDQLATQHGELLRPEMEIERPRLRFSIAREGRMATILPRTLFREFEPHQSSLFKPLLPKRRIVVGANLKNGTLTNAEQALLDVLQTHLGANGAKPV